MQFRDFVKQSTPSVSPTLSANRMHYCVVKLLEIPECTVYIHNVYIYIEQIFRICTNKHPALRTPTGSHVGDQGRQRETKKADRWGDRLFGVCSPRRGKQKQNTSIAARCGAGSFKRQSTYNSKQTCAYRN